MPLLKRHALAVVLMCWSGLARAQTAPSEDRRPLVTLSYALAIPASALRKEIASTSYQGFEYIVVAPLYLGWHLGVAANYNHFFESGGRRTYERERTAVTGTYYRSLTTASLSIVNRYYLGDADRPFRVYGGVRVGVSFGDVTRRIVDRGDDASRVGLLVAPEAGFSLRLCWWLELAAGYQFGFNTSSFGRADHITFHGVQVGPQIHY
ncbi:MAG TPA: hypothetical protein VI299_08800 [Polyangiales bacterium]